MWIWRSLLLCALLVLASAGEEIRVLQVDRKINLQSQFVRISETFKFKNTGNVAVDSLVLCTLTALAQKAAYVKAVDTSAGQVPLKYAPATVPNTPEGVSCSRFSLTPALPPGEVTTLSVEATIPGVQIPYPASIAQTETQLVTYADNVYVLSPYTVVSQTTEVLFPNNVIKTYTDTEKPTVKSDAKVRYGRYDTIAPFTVKPMNLHYENQKPFRTVTSLVREITVSHWGNIYVEETYEVKHNGAKLKGSFSRLKYMYGGEGKSNSYQDLRAHLPAPAHHLYYVDIIGNISTSNTRKSPKETVLDFKTRYPLMGGWKVDFMLGYSVPLEGFLFKKKSDGQFRLSMDFSTPIEDVFVEDLVVKVILPEGVTNIKHILPIAGVEASFEKKFTYLDIAGRPVLVLHRKNVSPELACTMNVDYTFATAEMMREPLLLVALFGALFLFAIAYQRLELTISRDDKWEEAQNTIKQITVMQQVGALVEAQQDAVLHLSHEVVKLRDPEDVDHIMAQRVATEKKIRELDDQMKPLLAKLEGNKAMSSAVAGVQDKLQAAQSRVTKMIADRVDLVKKSTPVLEITKKLATGNTQMHEAVKDLKEHVATVFAPY